VFQIAPNGTETVLHVLAARVMDGNPAGHLIHDGAGNLYGTTQFGGLHWYGTVFQLGCFGS